MSYGVWHQRGKNWRSVEIDSHWSEPELSGRIFDRFDKNAEKAGLPTFDIMRGEHAIVIAAASKAGFLAAIAKHELFSPYVEGRQALKIAEHFNSAWESTDVLLTDTEESL